MFIDKNDKGLYTYYVTPRGGGGGQPKRYQCIFHLYKSIATFGVT